MSWLTIIKVGLAVFCFLLALCCLFVKADDDPRSARPDAFDKAVYELIFRRGAPAPAGKDVSSQGARLIGFDY